MAVWAKDGAEAALTPGRPRRTAPALCCSPPRLALLTQAVGGGRPAKQRLHQLRITGRRHNRSLHRPQGGCRRGRRAGGLQRSVCRGLAVN